MEKKRRMLEVYTNENKTKTVFLQSMVHIGTEDFYENIRKQIEIFRLTSRNNGVILYEQAKRENPKAELTEDNDAVNILFSKLFGLENFDLSKFYDLTSKALSLELQNNNKLFKTDDLQVFNVDYSLEKISQILKERGIMELAKEYAEFQSRQNKKEQLDFLKFFENHKDGKTIKIISTIFNKTRLNKLVFKYLKNLNAKRIIDRTKTKEEFNLNAPVKDKEYYKKLRAEIIDMFYDVILKERNLNLIDTLNVFLEEGKYKDFYIVYGKAHFSPDLEEKYNIIHFLESKGFRKI